LTFFLLFVTTRYAFEESTKMLTVLERIEKTTQITRTLAVSGNFIGVLLQLYELSLDLMKDKCY